MAKVHITLSRNAWLSSRFNCFYFFSVPCHGGQWWTTLLPTAVYCIPILFGYTAFIIDFYTLPINREDVVLFFNGKTLGPVLTDYSHLTLQNNWQATEVFLQRVNDNTLEANSSIQLKQLHSTHSILKFYQMHMCTIDNSLTATLPIFL